MRKSLLHDFKELSEAFKNTPPDNAETTKPSTPVRRTTIAAPVGLPRSITGPQLNVDMSLKTAIEDLSVFVDGAFAARSIPGIMTFATDAVAALVAVVAQKNPKELQRKLPLRGLDELIAHGCAAGDNTYTATHCRKVLTFLSTIPAVKNGTYVSISSPDVQVPDSPGDLVDAVDLSRASSMLDVYMYEHDLNVKMLNLLDIAKTTKQLSLRDPYQIAMRRAIPDLGAPLVLAALAACGYREGGNEEPEMDFLNTSFVLQSWAENVLTDLRQVLAETNGDMRGELYSQYITSPTGAPYTLAEFNELSTHLVKIVIPSNATALVRATATAEYNSDRGGYDSLRAEWKALQRNCSDLQERALHAADTVLALIRWKKAAKSWRRANEENVFGQKGLRAPPGLRRAEQQRSTPSMASPSDALNAAIAAGETFEEGFKVPHFDLDALELTLDGRRIALAAAGLDGGRECTAYPGVIWEICLGPLYNILDYNQEVDDCRVVVIAPRRTGGMGLDLTEARWITIEEYESLFTPVKED
jgi:hypothetical protein